MFADEIRRAVEASPRTALPAVAALLWRALAENQVSEAEAEALSALIEARRAPAVALASPRRAAGSRPRSEASLERRRRWAASGRFPPAIAARFTLAEQAVLALIAAETARRGDCRLPVGHLAAIAGVSETTVRNAVREARRHGLVSVEERKVTHWRNLPNVVRVVSAEWIAWLRLAHRPGGGCKSANPTPTDVLYPVDSVRRPAGRAAGGQGSAGRRGPPEIRAPGRTGAGR